MQRRVITSVFFALVLEGEHPEERLEKLNERRRKLLGYLEKAEEAWVENPSEENLASMLNLRECIDDVQDEITALVNEL